MFWSHTPIAPWQDERWIAQMRRSLRPNQFLRMIENRFVASESTFVDLAAWDACVNPNLTPVAGDRQLPVWVGVDASVKRDSTALVAVTFDKKAQCCRLVQHRVFTPTPGDPIDFEDTVERTILDWRKAFLLRKVWFDPYQMASTAQRLLKEHVEIEEYPQTLGNLTAATSNLFDLVQSRSIALYPDAAMRLSVSRAIVTESSRGWKLDKMKQSHHIDVIVALSMACLAAVRGQSESSYSIWGPWLDNDDDADRASRDAEYQAGLVAHMRRFGMPV
jgi:phage terminase large subunit-like protein